MNRVLAILALIGLIGAGKPFSVRLMAAEADSVDAGAAVSGEEGKREIGAEIGEGDEILLESLNDDFLAEYDPATGRAKASQGARVTFRDAVLTAQSIELDPVSGQATAEGTVNLEQGGQVWTGDRLDYNFRTGAMGAEGFKLGQPPVFIGGERAVTLEPIGEQRVYSVTNAYVTTDDLAVPGYRIRARELRMYENKRIVARDATLMVGKVPVLWLPYFTRRLGDHPVHWVLMPGYRSIYGAYVRAAYEFSMGTNGTASIHVDPFSRRGIGLGPQLTYDLGRGGQGEFYGYWLADQDPGLDPLTGEAIEAQRDRITFSHKVSLRPGLSATAAVRRQSDRWVLRDFFEDDFRRNPIPPTFLEVEQAWADFTLNGYTRVRVNDSFETVERLPDVRLSVHRQELGPTGIYYEGENSLGWFQHRYAEPGPTNDYSAFRADSFHQLLYPKTLFGWLNVTPRVGGRMTYYGETQSDGWQELEARTRGVFNTGAELSFKAHRVWQGVENRAFDLDGLRHILEPSLNYAYTPEPNARPLELPQFDTELPSLRPLPVMYPDYNSIDSVDSQNVLRLGMRNKLQTKRDGKVEDVLDWAVMTDWRLDPRRDQSTFGDLYSEADFKPRRWLTVNSEVRVDPSAALLKETHTSAIFQPGNDWSFSVVHRYTRDDPFIGRGGDLLGTRLFLRFSESWGLRTSHYYEMREGILQEQYYTVYRDLRSLTAALTLRFRDNQVDRDDVTIGISISFKAYPRFRTGADAERPALLIGG